MDYDPEVDGLSLPYILTRELCWDGVSELQHPVFDNGGDGHWHLMMFFYKKVPFYLVFSFNHSQQLFILYILLGDTVPEAQKYRVKIWVEETKKEAPKKMVFSQRVVSIEAAIDTGIVNKGGILPISHYVVVPYQKMQEFFSIYRNDDEDCLPEEIGKWTVVLPIQVQGMRKLLL